jgi:nucleoside-diphosphate-sugar epimerase
VLDHWTDRGLAAVVAAGSAEEFGERGGVIAEDDPPAGRLSAYGWGKAAARTLLQSWAEGTGRPTLWLRPFVVYGPWQGGNMAVPYAIRQALDGLPAEFSDGVQRRDFVHVDDVAEAFRAALRVLSPGFTAVNVGTGKGTALRAVLELIGELTGAGK